LLFNAVIKWYFKELSDCINSLSTVFLTVWLCHSGVAVLLQQENRRWLWLEVVGLCGLSFGGFENLFTKNSHKKCFDGSCSL